MSEDGAIALLPDVGESTNEWMARKSAKDNLLAFTQYTHPQWETGRHHKIICKYLEMIEAGKITRLAIDAPPRHSKSELASRRFPAWYLGRHPDRQVICASAGGLLASDIGADVRDIIRDPFYRKVFPGVEIREDASAAGRWRTRQGGTYYAAGVGGTVVGRGANVAIVDDPHGGREDADSQRMRDIVGSWFHGDLLTRLMTPQAIVLIMTRWHEDDLAGRLMPPESEWAPLEGREVYQAGEWTVVRLRAIEFEGTSHEEALWPGVTDNRYPLPRLHQIKASMVQAGRGREWSAQYQQSPVAEEGTYLRRNWFCQRWSEIPEHVTTYLVSDFAVTQKAANNDPDRTELGIVGLGVDDRAYVLDWWSGITSPDVWIEKALDLVDQYKPSAFFGEKGVIKNAIEPLLNRRMRDRGVYARLEWMPTTSDKLARGRALQAWAASGRVVLPKSSPWVEEMVDELTKIGGGGRYWDKFDALAHFFLAIDDTHPAIVRAANSNGHRRQDYWDYADRDTFKHWKVA
jgi:predicted phage terminase large subunit-like protein